MQRQLRADLQISGRCEYLAERARLCPDAATLPTLNRRLLYADERFQPVEPELPIIVIAADAGMFAF